MEDIVSKVENIDSDSKKEAGRSFRKQRRD